MPERSQKNVGSFRDPKGHVYNVNGEIIRTITSYGIDDFEAVKATGLLDDLVNDKLLVAWEELDDHVSLQISDKYEKVLKHPKIAFISYPYEWSFSALKAAAILHLNIQIRALEKNVVLSDASAYNIQFQGPHPVFIDHLSFRPYKEGEFWLAHQQFCEHFLSPLLLLSYLGISYHAWYRGALEGLKLSDIAKILPFRAKFSPSVFTNVILPAWFEERNNVKSNSGVAKQISKKRLPQSAYMNMLRSLHKHISSLEPYSLSNSMWKDYEYNNTYEPVEATKKREFIIDFVKNNSAAVLWDVGCNTGEYSQVALKAGANKVIGFEYDLGALDISFNRAVENNLDFLPLYSDLANPSPSQGWMQNERQGFTERGNADAIIVLALIHHLCIGRNIPLPEIINWLIKQAPAGVIEFVPKTDPMIIELLQLREDIFYDYTKEVFEKSIASVANIVRTEVITDSGRYLVWYQV